MDTPDPALIIVEVEVAKSMADGAAVDLPVGHLRAAPEASSNVVPSKRLGNIIVQGGAPVPAATVAASKGDGRPKARPPARYRDADNICETEAAEAAKKKVVLKRNGRLQPTRPRRFLRVRPPPSHPCSTKCPKAQDGTVIPTSDPTLSLESSTLVKAQAFNLADEEPKTISNRISYKFLLDLL
ncbi:hypothetical protein D1007_10201 [Hordeum vulgare]|nr:hypothetical protein D1007_10201 [Hordeum vulgare]